MSVRSKWTKRIILQVSLGASTPVTELVLYEPQLVVQCTGSHDLLCLVSAVTLNITSVNSFFNLKTTFFCTKKEVHVLSTYINIGTVHFETYSK